MTKECELQKIMNLDSRASTFLRHSALEIRQWAQLAVVEKGLFSIVTTPPSQNHKTVFFRGAIPVTKSAGSFATGGGGSEISAGAA
jgi:hypothetical protein